MVSESQWLAVGGFASVMTLAWMFADRRITVTGLMAGLSWAWMAMLADDVTKYTDSGTEVSASAGSLAYFCIAMSFLSFLAVVLYQFGQYPPERDDPIRGTGDQA